ncbi:CW-type Zinc Finger family protein [Cryptosporidium felis]|nr:CW-type Zinc Finger family protein [Cryptosporidium felis]
MSSELVDWAQCELCKKWRKLPFGMNPNTLPEEWVCSMNTWDKYYNSCDVVEEVANVSSEVLHSNITNKFQYSDLQSRSIRGKRKGLNSFSNNSASGQIINGKILGNFNSNLPEENVKSATRVELLKESLSKSLFESLNGWSEKLKWNKKNINEASGRSEDEFPSCWPCEYKMNKISLTRNKYFEGFEKLRFRSNNFSGNDALCNLRGQGNYPVCIFKTNLINFENHPLIGRSVITGAEVSISFGFIGKSLYGFFPGISNEQVPKFSYNCQSNNSSTLIYGAQKIQSNISSNNSNFLELIPATRSDWSSPSIDLSNSLFINEDFGRDDDNTNNWKLCSSSYIELISGGDYSLRIPDYLNKTASVTESIPLINSNDNFIESLNTDVLDLFPIFSWLEDITSGNYHAYPKFHQSQIPTQMNKITKKLSLTRNFTRTKAISCEFENLENLPKTRRSSRNSNKTRNEKSDFEGQINSLIGEKNMDSKPLGEESLSISELAVEKETNFQIKEKKYSQCTQEFEASNLSVENCTDHNENSIRECSEHEYIEYHDTNLDICKDNIEAIDLPLDEQKPDNYSLKKETTSNNQNGDDLTNNSTDKIHSNDDLEDLKEDVSCNDSKLESNKLIEEYNFPLLGSYRKRNNSIITSSEQNTTPINTDPTNSEADITQGTSKKRLRKSFISETTNSIHDMVVEKCGNPKIGNEHAWDSDKETPQKKEVTLNNSVSEDTMEKVPLCIIPKKKSPEEVIDSPLFPKGDPWVPISDSSLIKRDNQVDEIIQPQVQRKNSSWQIDQRRQKSVDNRLLHNSLSHRNNYHQNKYRISTNYDPHGKRHSRHRNQIPTNSNSHHSSNSVYYGQNIGNGQTIQSPSNANAHYDHSNYKGYLNSKYSTTFSNSNTPGFISRHYRAR